MNIETFRTDFLARQAETGISQNKISAQYGVEQASLSRFLSGKSGLSFDNALKLWPFVYGNSFRATATPTTSPEGDAPGRGGKDAA